MPAREGPWCERATSTGGRPRHPGSNRVLTVQYLLLARATDLAPDGVFGPRTDTAVRRSSA